jgi:hypothetical protein
LLRVASCPCWSDAATTPPAQALGELPQAAAHARAALALQPRDAELKRLARELEAAAVQSAYEAELLRAASVALAGDASATANVEAELQLPPGAAGALAEVLRVVTSAKRASCGAAVEQEEAAAGAKGLAASLPRLRELLRAAPRNRDAFAAAGGVAALLACYAEDNLGVLSALLDAVTGCDRGAAALAAAADAPHHAQLLVHALRDRRLAVICAAADLLLAVAPASRAARAELCAPQYAETLVLMVARAPPPLAHRAVALLAALAAADAPAAAAALGVHTGVLCDALARMATPPAKGAAGGAPQRAAVSAAAALCRASEALRLALGGSPKLAAALLALLRADAGAAPEARRIDFSSGVSLVHRAWTRAPPDASDGLAAAMALAAQLARASPAWVSCWDEEEDAWALLLPLLHAPPLLSAPAVRLLAACAAAEPRCSVALADLGVAEALLELLRSDAVDAASREHAASLLRRCADCQALHRDLLRMGEGDDTRGLPAACALLTSPRSSDAAVEALAATAVYAAQLEPGALRYMAVTRPRFAHAVVRAWYERAAAPGARDALEAVLMALLSSDEGAAALAADADSEAHVTTLVADLRARRAATLMRATGGASVLNPASVGLATPYASVVFGDGEHASSAPLTPESTREAKLASVDAAALARYIGTLLPGCVAPPPAASTTPRPVVVDASGGGGALALRLARALKGASVYAAERSRAAVDGCVARAGAEDVRNLTSVFCADGSLDALPLPAHCVVAALCGAWLEEEPQALALAATKLRAGGTLLLVEEDPETLAAATHAARAAGLTTFAEPDVLNAFFVQVMRVA